MNINKQIENIFHKKFIQMEKADMIDMLISHYSNGNKALFARKLGVTPQAINGWQARGKFDAKLIYTKCEGISGDWLLSDGKGSGDKTIKYDESIISITPKD